MEYVVRLRRILRNRQNTDVRFVASFRHVQWRLVAERLCCRPYPRNQISNWYSYGYNDGISVDCEQYAKLGCNYVMQCNLGWSVATAKKKTAAHILCTCLCWNKVMSPICQKRPNFRISYFRPCKCRPLHSTARGGCPRSPLPFPAATDITEPQRPNSGRILIFIPFIKLG